MLTLIYIQRFTVIEVIATTSHQHANPFNGDHGTGWFQGSLSEPVQGAGACTTHQSTRGTEGLTVACCSVQRRGH